MARFGGNDFIGFSVPLVFDQGYFIMEPSNSPLITVVMEVDGEPVFEVLKNNPIENPYTHTVGCQHKWDRLLMERIG